MIGLFETKVIHHVGPWRDFDDAEDVTLRWVAWFNTLRITAPLGCLPPAEYEKRFYRSQHQELAGLN